jgi:UDP-N-acetyl-D-mannosaminuronate dehydrogenase
MCTCTIAASLFSNLKTRIDTRQVRVGVIGLGYVGLPLARCTPRRTFG